jgi:vitamin B12 transporter
LVSLNLRQALSSNYRVPFTPSFGFEYLFIATEKTKLTCSGNVARSYRLPTLNERYWLVLGNPDIRPENGFNKEAGLALKQTLSGELTMNLGLNLYHNLIDDWTYWNPDKGYRVENLQQVLARGFEFSAGLIYRRGHLSSGVNSIYALNNTTQQKVYDAYAADIVGKQLIYVPLHTVTNSAFFAWKDWSFTAQALYNSERYVTFDHSGRPFSPYFLMNALVTAKVKPGRSQGHFNVQVNNLTDTVYPSVKKNAMPGRSYSMGLQLNF